MVRLSRGDDIAIDSVCMTTVRLWRVRERSPYEQKLNFIAFKVFLHLLEKAIRKKEFHATVTMN